MNQTHLDTDRLADLHEGLLDPAETAAAQEHLAGCSACAADLAAIAGLPGALSGAAEVGPMPDDVVRRIDRALADAAATPVTGTAARTVTPLADRRSSGPRGMRLLQAAAVIVLLLAGGALGISALGGGDSNDRATSAGANGGAAREGSAPKSFRLTVSGRNWTAQTLASSVPAMAAGTFGPVVNSDSQPSPAASGGTAAGSGDSAAARELADAPAARLAGGPALAGCIAQLAGGPATPLAVDLAKYGGAPAAVVLLPTVGDPSHVDVWVVSPDCSRADAHLIYFARVAR